MLLYEKTKRKLKPLEKNPAALFCGSCSFSRCNLILSFSKAFLFFSFSFFSFAKSSRSPVRVYFLPSVKPLNDNKNGRITVQ